MTSLPRTLLVSALLASSALAQVTLPGVGERKLLGEDKAGTATPFSHYGKAVVGSFSHSRKLDVVTLMMSPSGTGIPYNLMGVGSYDGAFPAIDPQGQPHVRDIAALPGGFGELDPMVATSAGGVIGIVYDVLERRYECLAIHPATDADWIACGRFGGAAACDIAFSRGNELVVLEDVKIMRMGFGGDLVVQYQLERTIMLPGLARALCALNFIDAGDDLDELAVITSTGTVVLTAGGGILKSLPGPSQPGDLFTPREWGPASLDPKPLESLVTLGKAGGQWFVQEHTPTTTTNPSNIGAIQVLSLASGDVDDDGEADLVGKSALSEIPFVLVYQPVSAPEAPFSIANGDWFGNLPPGDLDPTNGMVAAEDFDFDGDIDVLTGWPSRDGWSLFRSDHVDNMSNVVLPEGFGDGGQPGPAGGIGLYEYDANLPGGRLWLALGQPAEWPRNVAPSLETARVLVRFWHLADGSAGVQEQSWGRLLVPLDSLDDGATLATIGGEDGVDTSCFLSPNCQAHDLAAFPYQVLSLEISLVEVDANDLIVQQGPSGFMMFSAHTDTRDLIAETYPNVSSDVACFDLQNGALPDADEFSYSSTGCQNFGKPPVGW